MHEPEQPLGGARHDGFVHLREAGPLGMISLRASAENPAVALAVKATVGLDMPVQRGINRVGDHGVAWMSPDEWLLLVPYADVSTLLTRLAADLHGVHHLAADVSDARAIFVLSGSRTDEVIARLCPVDLAALPQGEVRRTRLAQVACALWRQKPDQMVVVTFRSVARYAFDVLSNAAS